MIRNHVMKNSSDINVHLSVDLRYYDIDDIDTNSFLSAVAEALADFGAIKRGTHINVEWSEGNSHTVSFDPDFHADLNERDLMDVINDAIDKVCNAAIPR
jgi:hypothetical protein